MKPTSEVTACVVDNGLFVELAVTLARTFKKVYYCTNWVNGFPPMNVGRIGEGLEEIELTSSMFEHFDDIDLYVFPDCYNGWEQLHLAEMGKAVWGSRLGEDLELDRVGCKELMAKLKLPVGKYKVVRGLTALREYLHEHEDVFVKISKWRGMFETFHSQNGHQADDVLNSIAHKFGAFGEITDFIVEDALPDRVEVGSDGYTVDGKYPGKVMAGIEVKDKAYVGWFKDGTTLPPAVVDFNAKLAPVLEHVGYRGFYSNELRIGKDGVGYMIDCCCRAPSPPSELYQEFYTNLAEIIWQGANGVCIDPKPIAKCGVELIMKCSFANHNFVHLDFPEELKRNIKLKNHMRVDGRYVSIPQSIELDCPGAVIGWGDTMEAAMEMAKEIADKVDGYDLHIPREPLDEANKEIEKCREYGINMGSE